MVGTNRPVGPTRLTWHVVCISITTHGGLTTLYVICVKMPLKRCSWGKCNSDTRYKHKEHIIGVDFVTFPKKKKQLEACIESEWVKRCKRPSSQLNHTYVTNLGGDMARFTQFPLMITRLTIIYEIISPGAAGSSIYV